MCLSKFYTMLVCMIYIDCSTVHRLTLCEDLQVNSCGSLLFSGLIPPPHITSHDLATTTLTNLPISTSRSEDHVTLYVYISPCVFAVTELNQVIQIESHGNCIAAAYPQYVCLYHRQVSLLYGSCISSTRWKFELS